MTTWRQDCAPIIARVIHDVGKSNIPRLRKALRAAYPFGERKYWPYKVWLSEIKRQIYGPKKRKAVPVDKNQLTLF